MLGKLARWLRMLGQDTIYATTLGDLDLILRAKKENRILVTRDFELYQKSIKNKIKVVYVKTQSIDFLLSDLSKQFDFPLIVNIILSRCPKCNQRLEIIPKQEAAKKLKPKTLIHYTEFWFCSKCNSVYWQGSHWNKINSILQKARIHKNSIIKPF